MNPSRLVFCLLFTGAVAATAGEKLSCPDLATATPVGNCPRESDLQYTFTGYCSDDRRMYQQDTAVCTDYQEYRKLKNVVPWESADGAFMAYLSCELPADRIKAARASQVAVSRQGKITILACHYDQGITFTHRSHRECTVVGDGHCAGDPTACRASCE